MKALKHQPRIHHLVKAHATQTPAADAIVDSDGSMQNYAQYQAAISEAVFILRDYGVRMCRLWSAP